MNESITAPLKISNKVIWNVSSFQNDLCCFIERYSSLEPLLNSVFVQNLLLQFYLVTSKYFQYPFLICYASNSDLWQWNCSCSLLLSWLTLSSLIWFLLTIFCPKGLKLIRSCCSIKRKQYIYTFLLTPKFLSNSAYWRLWSKYCIYVLFPLAAIFWKHLSWLLFFCIPTLIKL